MAKKPASGRPPLFTIRADDDLWDALDVILVDRLQGGAKTRDRSGIVKEWILRERDRIEKAKRK